MSKADPRTIKYLPLEEITPDPRNPKEHDLDVIDASVSRFGYVEPQVVDGRTGKLISGHGRSKMLAAMRQRGEDPPEGITIDEHGQWLVPVVTGWSSRTDTEASAALIALNRAGELGGWVDESLLELLEDLGQSEDGYDGVGFGEKDRDDLKKLSDKVPDLDELADEWDGSGMADYNSGVKVTIIDQELAARWSLLRAEHDSDDEAIRTIL